MFSPKDKSAKEAALQKLMSLMDQGDHEELKGLKKPDAVAIDVTADKPMDGMDDDSGAPDHDGDEPSPEEKAQIAALYNRYCK